MADKIEPLVLAALSRAVAEPEGVPLFGSKTRPALSPNTAAGKQAARRCLDDGFLEVRRTEKSGRTTIEFCVATAQGAAFLLDQADPRQTLETFVDCARRMQWSTESLRATIETALAHLQKKNSAWQAAVLSHLDSWRATGDCPLPDLYRHVRQATPALTIGEFHDGLRQFHERERIYLHPWTGPLYAIPEPPYALMIGHEIAYYASPRKMAG